MLYVYSIGIYASTTVAVLAIIGWLLSSNHWLAVTAVVCVAIAAALSWIGADQVPDEIGDVPHPLDPYPEELRRRLAMGTLNKPADGADEDRTERRW